MSLFPKSVYEQHIIALGKTGAGKSSAIRNMVEELLDDDQRVIVITAKSDWWGLKLAADGKHAGYPIVVFGGDHSDMPLHHLSGKTMAELLGTGNRSAVVQMRDFMPGERTQFWIDFASTLFRRVLQGKLFLVIDEVHNFAPKGKVLDVKAGQMLHWSNKLASEARGLGITLIAASQRAAKVHNDFLTSCETLIAMRVTTSWDREAVKDWIEGCGDKEKGQQVLNTLAQMKRGDAWVWSPEVEFGPKQIHFPMFETYDSFRPQKPAELAQLKGWADVDLGEVKKKLEAVVRETEANDPTKLKARIAMLERECAAWRKDVDRKPIPAPDTTKLLQNFKRLEAYDAALTKYVIERDNQLEALRKMMSEYLTAISRMKRPAIPFLPKERYPVVAPSQPLVTDTPRRTPAHALPRPDHYVGKVRGIPVPLHAAVAPDGDGHDLPPDLPPGELAILKACAQYPSGLARNQLTVLTGYKRSSRDAYVARVKARGYIEDRQDRIFATEGGIVALGPHFEPLPEPGPALQAYWINRLPEGERKILQSLIDANGAALQRESLDQATGYRRSSRDAYLTRLAAKELVVMTGRGEVAAAPMLLGI